MIILEALYATICFFGSLSLAISYATHGYNFFTCVFIFVSITLVCLAPMALLCHWPQRYRQHKNEQRLLSLERKTVEGKITAWHFCETGKTENVSVPTGYSSGDDGQTYYHHRFESRDIYDGAYMIITENGTNRSFTIRSFPRNYADWNGGPLRLEKELGEMRFPAMEEIGHSFRVTYVVDTNGKCYFVSASRVS